MKKILALILTLPLFALPAAVASAQSGSGGLGLFNSGQYQSAYAAIQPRAQQGDPEALFLALIIRRNGLDGRKPAASETAVLWSALAAKSEAMQQGL